MLVLVLGTCPTLAVSTAASNAIGMGVAATAVLVGSNAVISLLRNFIPDKVRIPAFITVIAGFVSIVQLLVAAYFPEINDSLGIYLPLIVVNCIILGRAEMFASKNKVLASLLDGLGMGVGFTLALLAMGSIREILGAGTWFGIPLFGESFQPMLIMIMAPGGFFVFGALIAIVRKLSHRPHRAQESSCSACPLAASCSQLATKSQKHQAQATGECPAKEEDEA